MSDEIAIKVENLSKCYHIYDQPRDRLKQMILPRLQRALGLPPKQYFREFWALKDVSFEVKKGESVGIIGRNGSGKSTLLQLICGTLNPTSGNIRTNGRIAALLELGSGFNPEFTGRENVYLNGAVLGLSREEIDNRFDKIAAFADIGDFIDQPVKTYSSGMMVRLAFAVIAHVDADILVVDEALAVGDTFFSQKCMRFIRQFQSGGGTILFVSHDMTAIANICNRALLLYPGGQRRPIIGTPEVLCKYYLNQIYDEPNRHEQVELQRLLLSQSLPQENFVLQAIKSAPQETNLYVVYPFRADAEQFGAGGVTIIFAGFIDEENNIVSNIVGGELVSFIISVRTNKPIVYPAFGLMIKDRLGQFIFTEGTDKRFRHYRLVFKENERVDVIFRFIMPILIRGQYTINVAVAEGIGDDHIQHHWIHDAIKIESLSGPVVHGICGFINSEMVIKFVQ